LHVLDLTRNVAGPYATMILGDLGADVVKVENPNGGDDTRAWGPPFWEGWSPVFLSLNRNKRSIVLDLKAARSRAVMEQLAQRSDIIIESFRPGAMEELGYGYVWASYLNPSVIYCTVSAYGDIGPLATLPGYDPLIQAFSGIMSVTGELARPPVRVGVSIIDMGTGMWSALAVMAALLQRQQTGRGSRIAASLYETGLGWMAYHLASYWANGEEPGRHGSGAATVVPYQAYPTREGFLVIAAGNDLLFRKLADALGHVEWVADSRFSSNPQRVRYRQELNAAIGEVTATYSIEDLEERLLTAGVPCSRIRGLAEVSSDRQAAALDMFGTAAAASDPMRYVRLPFSVDGARPELLSRPPRLGEHTSEVLRGLNLPDDLLADLLARHRDDRQL
jgi:crotonobetainyl-CoA:carnitine CoA-transferase CaiB-like acyl-CoA transferase